MTNPSTTIRGVVHGKTIELEGEPGLPDGQVVSVTLKALGGPPTPSTTQTEAERRWAEARAQVENLAPGEGLKRGFGAWAEDSEELG